MISPEDYIIEDIINNSQVTAFYQPLVFIKKKRIAGYRAFCNGIDNDGVVIDADIMVRSADKLGLVLQIERLFRKKSIEGFSFFQKRNKEILLSVNVSSSAVKSGLTAKSFLSTMKNSDVDPSNIIIELVESDFEDTGMLTDFASVWRESGFMIAMDDFGTVSSNWDRIALVRPDLVKLDRMIIEGIAGDFFKQEVAHSLISLAHKAGALVVADGIETYDDALKMMELNADILQGDYFSVPCRPEEISTDDIGRKIVQLSQSYREHVIEARVTASEMRMRNMALLDRIIADILESGMYLPDDVINYAVKRYSSVECIYVLDDRGVQITDTVLSARIRMSEVGRIFHPDSIYSDQSNKDYYLNLVPETESYVSEPYISAATGNVCVTASKRYVTAEGEKRILCVDLST